MALPLALTACGGDSLQASLDDLAVTTLERRDLVGVGIEVRMPDGRVYASSAGTVAPGGAPYDLDTVQVLGSTTKLYTTVMILQLVEEGRLSLDDTIEPWVDVPDASSITIRDLLEHRSGLAEYLRGMTPEERARAWTPEELVARAVSLGPVGPREDVYARYANTNFTVLGLVLEQVTGRSWAENLEARIAAPLGLVHTHDYATGAAVEGWVRQDGAWVSVAGRVDPSLGWAVGSLTTTDAELLTFTAALFDGRLFHDPATLDLLTATLHPVDPEMLDGDPAGTQIGLGLHRYEIEGVVLVGHRGHITGYDSAAFLDPDTGAIVVVTTNTEVTGAAALTAYTVASHLHH